MHDLTAGEVVDSDTLMSRDHISERLSWYDVKETGLRTPNETLWMDETVPQHCSAVYACRTRAKILLGDQKLDDEQSYV